LTGLYPICGGGRFGGWGCDCPCRGDEWDMLDT
jgi:hypothetical protein